MCRDDRVLQLQTDEVFELNERDAARYLMIRTGVLAINGDGLFHIGLWVTGYGLSINERIYLECLLEQGFHVVESNLVCRIGDSFVGIRMGLDE